MVSLQAYTTFGSPANLFPSTQKNRIVSVNRPTTSLKKPINVIPKLSNLDINENLAIDEFNGVRTTLLKNSTPKTILRNQQDEITIKLYAILEAIYDRIETHNNIKEQRVEWNSLLLNSVNMITLTATTMVGVSTMGDDNLPLKVSSMVLFLGVTGLLSMIMNKIQPSQLAEEQRNAVRLYKHLKTKIENNMLIKNSTHEDIEEYMEEVLALDRAYPLPLLGAMLDKYPETYKPTVWWPSRKLSPLLGHNEGVEKVCSFKSSNNGWCEELEVDMRDILKAIEKKDFPDYVRLGNKALKLSKILAGLGPLLTGIAAVGSGVSIFGATWGGVVAAVAGAVASLVNTMEHGGQVGMVFEMYRNCGGFFVRLEENVESMLEEQDFDKRENGELFELKMGLILGRSLSELKELAENSRKTGGYVDRFASKLI